MKAPGSEPLKVAVRFRPLSDYERQHGAYEVFHQDPDNPMRVVVEDSKSAEEFAFNHVFSAATTNGEVFSELVDLEPLLDGIHTTVFAYGVTGSGKTHTMLGTGSDEGVMQRTIKALFEEIGKRTDKWQFTVRLSVIQVYNENVQDLLGGGYAECLSLMDDKVIGCSEPQVKSAEETIALIYRGNNCRKTASTNKNEHSSRSHLLCRLTVDSLPIGEDGRKSQSIRARLTLVDLAGSEGAETAYGTTSERDRMAEGKTINTSLLQLQRVFHALAEGRAGGHIPFRGSKLTQLLQESLSGQGARMTMICATSPARLAKDRDPTLSTLRFAKTSSTIKIMAAKNVVINPELRVKELEAELFELQRQLRDAQALVDNVSANLAKGAGEGGSEEQRAQAEALLRRICKQDRARMEELQWQLVVQKSQKAALVRDRDAFSRLSSLQARALLHGGAGAFAGGGARAGAAQGGGSSAGGGGGNGGGGGVASEAGASEAASAGGTEGGALEEIRPFGDRTNEGSAAVRAGKLRRALSTESLAIYTAWQTGDTDPSQPADASSSGAGPAAPAPGHALGTGAAPALSEEAAAAARALPWVAEGGALGALARAAEAIRTAAAQGRYCREITSIFEEMNMLLEEYREQQRDNEIEWRLNMVTADRNLLENANSKLESENAALRAAALQLRTELAEARQRLLQSGARCAHFESVSQDFAAFATQLQADKEALESALHAVLPGGDGGPGGSGARTPGGGGGGGGRSGASSPRAPASRSGTASARSLAAALSGAAPAPARRGAPGGLPPSGAAAREAGAGGLGIKTAAWAGVAWTGGASPGGHRRIPSVGSITTSGGSPRARAAALLSADQQYFTSQYTTTSRQYQQYATMTQQAGGGGGGGSGGSGASSPGLTPRLRADVLAALRCGPSLIGTGASLTAGGLSPSPSSPPSRAPAVGGSAAGAAVAAAAAAAVRRSRASCSSGGGGAAPPQAPRSPSQAPPGEGGAPAAAPVLTPAGASVTVAFGASSGGGGGSAEPGRQGFDYELRLSSGPIVRPPWALDPPGPGGEEGGEAPASGAPAGVGGPLAGASAEEAPGAGLLPAQPAVMMMS